MTWQQIQEDLAWTNAYTKAVNCPISFQYFATTQSSSYCTYRWYRKGFLTADIENVFHQISADSDDRDYVRFLLICKGHICTDLQGLYRKWFARITFGVTSSPFFLTLRSLGFLKVVFSGEGVGKFDPVHISRRNNLISI